ncbi:MAG: hypothetical protein QGI24_05430, partial [Kiritimatiellia bacterium]|nr:hypothetical protein [Kiritimatiellia bacterium]
EQALAEAVEALEQAQQEFMKSATSKAELESLLAEALPNAGEEAPTPPTSSQSPGDLPEVSPTDSESETQEDRSSEEAAELAGEGEGEETGDQAGSEMPEGEGKMPGSVGKSETSTGQGDTPIGMPDPGAEGTAPEKTNPRDPNKPKMPAPAAPGAVSEDPPEGEPMPPQEGMEAMAPSKLGGTSGTEASGENYELKALAADVFERGTKKGGLQSYLPQLPAEYRKQIKAYYEVLAQ